MAAESAHAQADARRLPAAGLPSDRPGRRGIDPCPGCFGVHFDALGCTVLHIGMQEYVLTTDLGDGATDGYRVSWLTAHLILDDVVVLVTWLRFTMIRARKSGPPASASARACFVDETVDVDSAARIVRSLPRGHAAARVGAHPSRDLDGDRVRAWR